MRMMKDVSQMPQAAPKKRLFRFEKLRMPLAWLGGLFLFLFATPSEQSFRFGVPIAMIGMAMRVWASGHIQFKSIKLATGGPFAYVRNPLYVGNFLIGLGIVTVANNLIVTAVFLIGFAILYVGTIRKEESHLRQSFGASYEEYLRAVPRFFPRWTPYAQSEKTPFQWRLILKHRELETLFGLLLALTGLYLWEEIVREGHFLMKEKIAIAAALVFILGLVLERFVRKSLNS